MATGPSSSTDPIFASRVGDQNRAKKEIRTVQSGRGPFLRVRILPGKNHPGVFCSQGNGGFPALRLSTGAPNLRMSVAAWSMTSVYPVSTRTTGVISVHSVSRVGQTNSVNCPPLAVGDALPCGSRSLDPSATLPFPRVGVCRPPSPVSWRPSVRFRLPGSNTVHSPRRGRSLARPAPCCRSNPAEAGGGGASFVPDRDKSLWAPGPTHSQGAFSSEDGSKSPSRLRSGGLSITPLQVAPSVSTPSGCPSLPGEDPRPKRWVVVADTTRVGQNFGLTCIARLGVFHNVNTRVFHNCGYRVSLSETHRENTISPAPDHGPRRGRVDVHKKDVSESPRCGHCRAGCLACRPPCRCPRASCAHQRSSLADRRRESPAARPPPGRCRPAP